MPRYTSRVSLANVPVTTSQGGLAKQTLRWHSRRPFVSAASYQHSAGAMLSAPA